MSRLIAMAPKPPLLKCAKLPSPIELGAAVILAAFGFALIWAIAQRQPVGMDFAPVWAAASNPSIAYDPEAISAIQAPLFQNRQFRPFAYPPTALLLFTPLGILPLGIATGIFIVAAVMLFLWASLRACGPWWLPLSPPVMFSAFAGQPSLLAGGLIYWGMTSDRWRSVLFGLAIAIKPQLCVLLPLSMILRREWRDLAGSAAVAALAATLATLVLGMQSWNGWLGASDALMVEVTSHAGLAKNRLWTHPLLFAFPACLFVWLVREAQAAIRSAALIGAALLVSPYAMEYELALVAPGVPHPVFAVLLGIGFLGGTPVLAIILFYLGFRAVNARDRSGRLSPAPRAQP